MFFCFYAIFFVNKNQLQLSQGGLMNKFKRRNILQFKRRNKHITVYFLDFIFHYDCKLPWFYFPLWLQITLILFLIMTVNYLDLIDVFFGNCDFNNSPRFCIEPGGSNWIYFRLFCSPIFVQHFWRKSKFTKDNLIISFVGSVFSGF